MTKTSNIACGRCHEVLITKQGEIFSKGEGTGGKLGHGLENDAQQTKVPSHIANGREKW